MGEDGDGCDCCCGGVSISHVAVVDALVSCGEAEELATLAGGVAVVNWFGVDGRGGGDDDERFSRLLVGATTSKRGTSGDRLVEADTDDGWLVLESSPGLSRLML